MKPNKDDEWYNSTGYGYGDSYGDGYGSGSGYGHGYGDGYGSGSGSGYGDGSGSGSGSGYTDLPDNYKLTEQEATIIILIQWLDSSYLEESNLDRLIKRCQDFGFENMLKLIGGE